MAELLLFALSLIGCVFAASASGKLRDRTRYRRFRDGLRDTGLVPARLLPAAAAVLCTAEAALATGLLAAAALTAAAVPGALPVAGAALTVAAGLVAVLTAGIGVVLHRGTRVRCACFGATSGLPLGPTHLVRNLVLLAVALVGAGAAPVAHGHPGSAGAILAAAGALGALPFIRWEDLTVLLAPEPRRQPHEPAPRRR